MAVDQVRINGNVYSWGSLTVKVGGERWYRLTSISYADKRERVKAYGQAKHQAPTGRSRGKYAVEPVKAGSYRMSGGKVNPASRRILLIT